MRSSKRKNNETRKITFKKDSNSYAEGACLVNFGNTKILCTASLDKAVPKFLRNTGTGWLTATYAMLPRATHKRVRRDIENGKISGRTQEIQRLIGRSLRTALNLEKLGERQIIIDCDVLQADGGTRTAAITGGYVALALAIKKLMQEKIIVNNPLKGNIAAISCGIDNGTAIIDLDYQEDSSIEVDANFVLNSKEEIVEIQASAEGATFKKEDYDQMYNLASDSMKEIFRMQNEVINS